MAMSQALFRSNRAQQFARRHGDHGERPFPTPIAASAMNEAGETHRLRMHANYERLVDLTRASHAQGRTTSEISERDITLARLYSHAFRAHVIGAFSATRAALLSILEVHPSAQLQILTASELLADLANRAMDSVGHDVRALISTFHHYRTHVARTVEALDAASDSARSLELAIVRDRFASQMEAITTGNGIHLTQDTAAPEQASFVVPGLGITIVPLVYGDHHSWNLAWLDGERSEVPYHLHREGAEIHLGYSPVQGYTVLGDARAEINEGYAMPIPPNIRHGYTNIGPGTHHVPFIFGSLTRGGWGIFFDVEPRPKKFGSLRAEPVSGRCFPGTILLEQEIDRAAQSSNNVRYVLIPAAATDRDGVGGLELSISRVTDLGLELQLDRFLAVSVVGGRGIVAMAGEEREIARHDHFGVPSNVTARIHQTGDEPLVLLDAVLKTARKTST
jgi:mannose-6-phosphate isomerase-like protein (cupin superfamily)